MRADRPEHPLKKNEATAPFAHSFTIALQPCVDRRIPSARCSHLGASRLVRVWEQCGTNVVARPHQNY